MLAGVFALAQTMTALAEDAKTLDLGDGYRFELIAAGQTTAKIANPKSLYVNVALKDDKILADHAKLIEAADRLFESVLMGAAEKGYYTRATVNIRKPAAAATAAFEDFLYVRGENEVWLRQAGAVAWKVAQDDTKWTPPAAENVEIAGFGTFAVETAVEIAPPAGFHRAAEIDVVTKTPVIDIQKKYREIKALWAQIDRAKMKTDGFDMVLFGNYAEAQRGRFHARKGFFVRIPREEGGDWPELPDRAPDNRDLLISKNDLQLNEVTEAIRVSFARGMDTVRLASFTTPRLGADAFQQASATATAAAVVTQVDYATGTLGVTAELRRSDMGAAALTAPPAVNEQPARNARVPCRLKCVGRAPGH